MSRDDVPVLFADVLDAATRVSLFPKSSLMGRVRSSHQRLTRFALWHVAAEVTGVPIAEMGRRTAIDPTSVAYGIRRAGELIAAGDTAFIARRDAIRAAALAGASARVTPRTEVMA